ncbi:MAG TPA: translocation/assembly module TamB, partial [Sphingomicrobium sp.]|nr:translocation/assembly module TamB [Sphingomicrobium sp.]
MAEIALDETKAEPPRYRLKPDWPRRLARELLVLFLGLAFLVALGLFILDTAPGHRWIVDRIAQIETSSGLRFRIGRIDGTIFGESKLKNVAILDHHGTFFTSPEITLDWSPGAWLFNELAIDRLHADRATLIRRPDLKPSARKGPTLPSFDIQIGQLSIERFEVGKAVTGTPRVGQIQASADVRSGRAMVKLGAVIAGSDRLFLKLDAEPDGDRFDLEVRAQSAAGGVLPALAGSKRPLSLVVTGDGTWTRWRGGAALDLSGRPTARLGLAADSGRFSLRGRLAPSQFLAGRGQRLTTPVVRVAGSATLENRVLDGQMVVGSAALRVVTSGALDLAGNEFRAVRVGIDLLRPPALFPNMTGRNVRALITLNGPFATATYAYRLTSPGVTFDDTGFIDVRAEGRGKL